MSPVITLRARLVAACAIALVALTGCSDTATDPHDGMTRLDLGDALGTVHSGEPDDLGGIGTGVSAALDLADQADLAAQLPAPAPSQKAARTTSASAPAPAPVVSEPAPAPVVPEPAPVEPTCATGEAWDGERCVAQQLPEESVGGARCGDTDQVVVAILEDGTPVCGPAGDTVAGA